MPCLVQHFSNDGPTSVLRFDIPLGGLEHSRKTRAVVRLIDVQHVIGCCGDSVMRLGGSHTRRLGENPKRRAREACGLHPWRHPPRIARERQIRQEDQPRAVREIAWRAQLRLCQRYRRLSARGINLRVHRQRACRLHVGYRPASRNLTNGNLCNSTIASRRHTIKKHSRSRVIEFQTIKCPEALLARIPLAPLDTRG
jgi:hypothetical protein